MAMLYLSPISAIGWDSLPGLKPTWESEIDCVQQLDAFAETFCSGDRLIYTTSSTPSRTSKMGSGCLRRPIFGFLDGFTSRTVSSVGVLNMPISSNDMIYITDWRARPLIS